jgi:transcriptional regulator with XRE-family HTH domain
MDKTTDTLGLVIKQSRINNGLTQKSLAAELSISARHLLRIEHGHEKPSYDLLRRLIRRLKIPTDQIFFPEILNNTEAYNQAVLLLKECDESTLRIINTMLFSLLDIN